MDDRDIDPELARIRAERLEARIEAPALKVETGIIELTDDNFEEMVGSHGLMIVDFWAEWCAPCHMVAPVLKEVAKEHAGEVTIGKVNVDHCRMVSGKFGIQSIPTLMFFKDGKPVTKIVGAVPKAQIEDVIQQVRSV